MKWSRQKTTGDLPSARYGHSACIIDHHMYIFGGFGEEENQVFCDVHCLDLKTMHWTFIETFKDAPIYRDFHTATILNNRMYILGGSDNNCLVYPYPKKEGKCSQSRIVYLDLETKAWHTPNTTGDIPIDRGGHAAFVFNSLLYIFGGYNCISDEYFNDLYCFDTINNIWSLVITKDVPSSRSLHVCLLIEKRLYLFGGTG